MRYTIRNRSEGFDCPQCGEPLYPGDTAWQDGTDGDCYCSARCCEKSGELPRGWSLDDLVTIAAPMPD